MIGGGKAGNLMSPNPNAIAASDTFKIPLTSVMVAGIIPAVFGLALTYLLAKRLTKTGTAVAPEEAMAHTPDGHYPSFAAAIAAPVVAIVLLALRPIADIKIDPLIALPVGGLVGAIIMGAV